MNVKTRSRISPFPLLALAFFAGAVTAPAAITYSVTFSDPGGTYSSFYPQITTSLQAAGARWAQVLAGSGSLEIQVEFTTGINTLDGASFTSGFVRKNGARDVFEQGAAFEIRTGTDPNGATPDIRVRINPNYMAREMFFDPDPSSRTAPIPPNHQDALSLFIHELGHAFVFSGFMDGTNGTLPATYESTFDEQVRFDGTNFFFVGSAAQAIYGKPVPLTYGNYGHLGNNSPRPGSDLLNDLMNGISYTYGMRYDISALDLAIAKDVGLTVIPPARLQNISTRLKVLTGDNALIGGFIVTGSETKRVILRAIGPSLTQFGVAGALADPRLELHDSSGGTIATNDNWRTTQLSGVITADQQADIQNSGAAPTNDKESAIIASLAPGSYTAVLRGVNDTTGVALIEAYDLSPASNSQLGNISTRGFVDTGDNAMIGGFILGPAASSNATIVVRAIGPSLAAFGISNALQDPFLELHDANGSTIATNDNWQTDAAAATVQAKNLAPRSSLESALLRTLAPGAYTAVMRGNNSGTGVGLIEAYSVQ